MGTQINHQEMMRPEVSNSPPQMQELEKFQAKVCSDIDRLRHKLLEFALTEQPIKRIVWLHMQF